MAAVEDLFEDRQVRRPPIAEVCCEVACRGALRGHDEGLDEATEALHVQPVEQRPQTLCVALRPLDRAGVEADDIEQDLMRVARLADEGDGGELIVPVALHRQDELVKPAQVTEPVIALDGECTNEIVARSQPVHARKGGGRQDAVGLRANADGGNGARRDDKAAEELAGSVR